MYLFYTYIMYKYFKFCPPAGVGLMSFLSDVLIAFKGKADPISGRKKTGNDILTGKSGKKKESTRK